MAENESAVVDDSPGTQFRRCVKQLGSPQTAFRAFDRSNSGVISKKDFKGALTAMGLKLDSDTRNSLRQRVTGNRKRKISFTSFKAFVEEKKQEKITGKGTARPSQANSSSLVGKIMSLGLDSMHKKPVQRGQRRVSEILNDAAKRTSCAEIAAPIISIPHDAGRSASGPIPSMHRNIHRNRTESRVLRSSPLTVPHRPIEVASSGALSSPRTSLQLQLQESEMLGAGAVAAQTARGAGAGDDQYQDSHQCPAVMLCPITDTMMKNPVIAADGHTYEKVHIEDWMGCYTTSPKTNAPLPHKILIPNHVSPSN